MHEEAKAVLGLLHKRNYEAFYIGGKCRVELHNQFHPECRVDIKDIDIITNATADQIKAIFPRSDVRGESFQVVAVHFGGFEFEIATYRKDIYNQDELKTAKKTVKPKTEIAASLDEDRSRRDYTINAIAEDIDGNYIDYVYTYRNKKISAIEDIKEGIIRAIGNAKLRFEEDPLRILRAFRIVSQLGYEIEKQTLKVIVGNLELLEKIPHERIGPEMNKIILGQNASVALTLMREIGVFKLNVFNSIKNVKTQLLPGLNELTDEYYSVLDKFNSVSEVKNSNSIIEAWALLFKPLGSEVAKQNLETIFPINSNDIEKVEWLIEHFDLIDSEDIRNDIFKARTGIVLRYKMMCMRELLKKLCKIHTALFGKLAEPKAKALIHAFCSRPYFHEQLKVTGEEMMEIAREKPGKWISVAKDKLLQKLINTKRFPKDPNLYMELVQESVEEALVEETMKEEGLI